MTPGRRVVSSPVSCWRQDGKGRQHWGNVMSAVVSASGGQECVAGARGEQVPTKGRCLP